jgi:hypothetical protein
MPADSVVRDVVFDPGTLRLRTTGRRRRGRPRITWAAAVREHAVKAAGGEEQLAAACLCAESPQARQAWARKVRAYTSSLVSYNT